MVAWVQLFSEWHKLGNKFPKHPNLWVIWTVCQLFRKAYQLPFYKNSWPFVWVVIRLSGRVDGILVCSTMFHTWGVIKQSITSKHDGKGPNLFIPDPHIIDIVSYILIVLSKYSFQDPEKGFVSRRITEVLGFQVQFHNMSAGLRSIQIWFWNFVVKRR